MTEHEKIKKLFQKLLVQPKKLFPREGYDCEASKDKGVYLILKGVKVLHVGSTPRAKEGIGQRLKNHLQRKSSFVSKFLKGNPSRLRQDCSFQYLTVKEGRQRKLLESYATGMLCPEHLGVG